MRNVRRAVVITLVLLVPQYAMGEQAGAGGRGNPPANNGPNDLRTTNRTIYTGKTELFITFRPTFIVGETARIGAHLSKLGDRFTPYSDNTVTVTLNVAGVDTKTSVPKPDRPGVFRLELTPTQAGIGNLTVDISGTDGSDRLVIPNITVYAAHADAVAHQEPNNPDAGAIRYSKEMSWDENEYASAPVAKVAVGGSPVLAVPQTAIVHVDGVPRVYVQRNPEAFDLKEVKTGKSNVVYVEITQGLREGDRIVTRGGEKMPRQ